MNKKKVLSIVLAITLVASLAIGGTLAYFHDEESATNKFTTANNDNQTGVDVELKEPNWNEDKGKDVMPGDVIPKDPTVTNKSGDSYMRMIVTIQDKAGNVITDKARADKILSMVYYANSPLTTPQTAAQLSSYPTVNPAFEKDATRGSVGVYYYNYKGVFAKDAKAVLFTGVVVPSDWTQDDITTGYKVGKIAIGDFDIVVKSEAIQTKNITSQAAAYTALDSEVAKP